ncbi:MAG: ABC transporter permease [Bacteroidetes bacterium]|jgi:phospholipid/cholesterol/gamma-HCH transport system permease protein|nr:ABC transporter permease [Bacteroidota bacterium]
MNPIAIIAHIGQYFLLLGRVFRKPEKSNVFWQRFFHEVNAIGIGSLGIVAIISIFMGAVITIQAAFGFESPWIPLYAVGLAARDSIILEFSPTIVSLILAGKVGSSIASELGNMRVSEQIDAIDVMGVNSASYLILPKIAASVFIFPFVVTISMFLGHIGGFVLGVAAGVVTPYEFIYGIQYEFRPYNVVYALIKTLFFGFIIPSVSAYHGYYTKGGSLEVGQSSTRAVVYSIIVLLLFNFLLTQLLLA